MRLGLLPGYDPHLLTDEEYCGRRAAFTIEAWLETLAIEEALDEHDCTIERRFFWVGREYLFK